MPQSIYDNGGMIGATLDFGDTSTYPSALDYNNTIATTSGGSPTFRWRLDGNINEVGGHTTSETGTPLYTTGLINGISGQSADFSGSYNIDIANTAFINTGNSGGTYVWTKRSLSFWFNADSTTSYKAIWEEGGGVNWFVIYLEGGLIYANIGESSVTGGHATASVSAGQTYHCLVTVDLTLGLNQIKIYLNGDLAGQATSSVGTDLSDHSGDNNIGSSNARNHQSQSGVFTNYDGKLQDFCYWFEEALTLTDAQNIYASGTSSPSNQKNSGIWSLSSVLESISAPVVPTPLAIEYLVIAGGGGGGRGEGNVLGDGGAGGGAGGYRSSVQGELSGANSSPESVLTINTGESLAVTIGAGGVGATNAGSGNASPGTDSVLGSITSIGGGIGGSQRNDVVNETDRNGGSGGGAGGNCNDQEGNGGSGGLGTTNQGFDGGDDLEFDRCTSARGAGGGGGAGSVGQSNGSGNGSNGGIGIASSISGVSTYYAGGGGGGAGSSSSNVGGTGGAGGGGNGGRPPQNGTSNTGGGGGGSSSDNTGYNGGSGGSGVVILRYPSAFNIDLGPGLTGNTSTVGANKVTTITAGTGNISFS